MVSIPQRMRKLQTKLLSIRTGPGSLVLPKDVKRIHLRFAPKMAGGHMGPRKFWHEELVRLKYHNPAVPMSVDRNVPQDDSATLSVHFASKDARQTSNSATSSPAPVSSTAQGSTTGQHDPVERVESVDINGRTNSEILQQLVQITKAYPIETTPDDVELLRSLDEQRARSLEDSKRSKAVRDRRKREEEMLKQARGELLAS